MKTHFDEITGKYARLRIAVIGDYCLDRYLEIDPARAEVSIETGLEVHNVVNVRSQPGAAGTILNNLVALGVGQLFPVGFCGEDGEGFELLRALQAKPGLRLDHFVQTAERRTFTYCKPLVLEPGRPPRELNRLDSKNWSPTPETVQRQLIAAIESLAERVDALILMDQVEVAETGVVTRQLLEAVRGLTLRNPKLLVLADSRRSLRGYPPVGLKMNARELALLTQSPATASLEPIPVGTSSTSSHSFVGPAEISLEEIRDQALALARSQQRPVFVTLSERGIIGATGSGLVEHVPALPVRGEIDVVGAGDAVTANLTAALAAGASLREALELSMAAASVVLHQLGTTGTASIAELRGVLG